jgi:RNA polymerase sigma factor (sigma-70 family)
LPMDARTDGNGPEDIVVIQRVLEGDAGQFRHLVRRYGERVRRFCLSRLGNEEEAVDATQEVFVRAYRALGTFKVGRAFVPWLFAIAANRVRTRWGRSAGRESAEQAVVDREPRADGPDPEQHAIGEIERADVRSAVASLALPYRVVVELYYFAGLSVGETAETLGLGEEAVKSRLLRARRLLARSPFLAAHRQPAAESGGIQ